MGPWALTAPGAFPAISPLDWPPAWLGVYRGVPFPVTVIVFSWSVCSSTGHESVVWRQGGDGAFSLGLCPRACRRRSGGGSWVRSFCEGSALSLPLRLSGVEACSLSMELGALVHSLAWESGEV